MTTIPDRNTFETAYAGKAPWDIGRPQQAFRWTGRAITASARRCTCVTPTTTAWNCIGTARLMRGPGHQPANWLCSLGGST